MIKFQKIYGEDGVHRTPYMTRMIIGRFRFHLFHRGDADPDHHDHPWGFWTFPLRSYVEEVTRLNVGEEPRVEFNVVRAFRFHYRPATYTHRVLGVSKTPKDLFDDFYKPGKIPTLIWTDKGPRRKWGFLKNRDGQWCWVPWREYVFGGGKHAPCQDEI